MKLYTFIILSSLFLYFIDIYTSGHLYDKCKDDIQFNMVLLFHHFIKMYILVGWYTNNKKHLMLYIGFIILSMVHWFKNNNQCMFTEYIRKKCGVNKYIFKDIFYYTGYKTQNSDIIYYGYYCVCIIYALHKIINQ